MCSDEETTCGHGTRLCGFCVDRSLRVVLELGGGCSAPRLSPSEVSNDEILRNSFPRILRKEFHDVVE